MSGGSRVSPGGSSSQQLLGRAGGQIVADRRSSRPSPGGGPRETPGDSNDRRRPSRSSSRRAPLDEHRWEESPAAPRSRRAPRGRGPGSPKRTPGAASPPAPPRPETTPRKLAAPRRPPALPRRRRRCDARRRRRGETKRRSRETRRAACGAGEKQPYSGGDGARELGRAAGGARRATFLKTPRRTPWAGRPPPRTSREPTPPNRVSVFGSTPRPWRPTPPYGNDGNSPRVGTTRRRARRLRASSAHAPAHASAAARVAGIGPRLISRFGVPVGRAAWAVTEAPDGACRPASPQACRRPRRRRSRPQHDAETHPGDETPGAWLQNRARFPAQKRASKR